jgi:hypothetical protein
LRFNDYQLSSLELKIHQSQGPAAGARLWAKDNERLTGSWIKEAKKKVAD